MKKFKKLISSYGFWTGLSAAVIMLAGSIAKAFGFSINNQAIEDVIMSICGILVVFGVVSVPPKLKTDKNEASIETTDQNHSDEESK